MITQFDMITGDAIENDQDQPALQSRETARRAALRLMTVAEATEMEGVCPTLSRDSAIRRFAHWLAGPAGYTHTRIRPSTTSRAKGSKDWPTQGPRRQ
jgi:hypothetical protein